MHHNVKICCNISVNSYQRGVPVAPFASIDTALRSDCPVDVGSHIKLSKFHLCRVNLKLRNIQEFFGVEE
jgi:hypothetical protein